MAVSKKAKGLYMGFFDGIETFAANTISNIQEERYLKRYLSLSKKSSESLAFLHKCGII